MAIESDADAFIAQISDLGLDKSDPATEDDELFLQFLEKKQNQKGAGFDEEDDADSLLDSLDQEDGFLDFDSGELSDNKKSTRSKKSKALKKGTQASMAVKTTPEKRSGSVKPDDVTFDKFFDDRYDFQPTFRGGRVLPSTPDGMEDEDEFYNREEDLDDPLESSQILDEDLTESTAEETTLEKNVFTSDAEDDFDEDADGVDADELDEDDDGYERGLDGDVGDDEIIGSLSLSGSTSAAVEEDDEEFQIDEYFADDLDEEELDDDDDGNVLVSDEELDDLESDNDVDALLDDDDDVDESEEDVLTNLRKSSSDAASWTVARALRDQQTRSSSQNAAPGRSRNLSEYMHTDDMMTSSDAETVQESESESERDPVVKSKRNLTENVDDLAELSSQLLRPSVHSGDSVDISSDEEDEAPPSLDLYQEWDAFEESMKDDMDLPTIHKKVGRVWDLNEDILVTITEASDSYLEILENQPEELRRSILARALVEQSPEPQPNSKEALGRKMFEMSLSVPPIEMIRWSKRRAGAGPPPSMVDLFPPYPDPPPKLERTVLSGNVRESDLLEKNQVYLNEAVEAEYSEQHYSEYDEVSDEDDEYLSGDEYLSVYSESEEDDSDALETALVDVETRVSSNPKNLQEREIAMSAACASSTNNSIPGRLQYPCEVAFRVVGSRTHLKKALMTRMELPESAFESSMFGYHTRVSFTLKVTDSTHLNAIRKCIQRLPEAHFSY